MEEWLRTIGLEKYLTAFRRHGIDSNELADLTDDDLRELGLTIGERKRFRRALDEIEGVESARRRAATLPERRPLTVVFIDLIGSTDLGERLEVEDMLEVIRLYRERCGTAIARYGGSIARFVGDGIQAYFCYPVAHENDAERAIRASLEIANNIGRLASPAGQPLAVRIGAATGRVIVSDLLNGGLVDARTIIGSTPNLAARLQSLASPNSIVISEATHQRVESLFRCEAAGVQELKGFATPQRLFRVLAEVPGGRSVAQKPARLTPFFGREEEFAVLEERWQRVERGEGGTVVITGEPGIGKSRLVERFLSARQDGSARIVALNASPFDADSPLLPLSVYFRTLAQFDADDPPPVRSRKLWDALAGSASDRDHAVAVLAEFLGLADGNDALRAMPPPQLRDRAFAVIVAHLRALSEKTPVCLVTEDAHWLDPTTREFLSFLADQTADCRLLLLVTTREDATEVNWLKPAHPAHTIRLERLGTSDVVRMVQSLLGDQPVPTGIANQIARKTDGVPLYVEEFLRPLMDTPALVDWSKVELDEAGPAAAIPASLHEAFVARLDGAGEAKAIVQTAAVIGRVARRDILAAVSELSETELDNAVRRLGQAGVLHPDKVAGHPGYAFDHALVRDAAYDSVLRDRRRELHVRVAKALRKLDPDCVEQQPELLALHLAEGGLVEEAVPYWLQAARRSLTRSALLEATRFLQRGLSVLAALPRTAENTERRIIFAALLGPALIALKGPGSAEARDLYAEAYEICLETPEGRQHFPIYWGWWRMARDCLMMKARADALLRRARKSDDPEMLLQAHHCNWASHYDVGDLRGCCKHIEAGMAIYQQGNYRDHAVLYGNHDAKVCAHGELAQVYWMQGRLRMAAIEGERSLGWARELQHLGSTAHAMDMALLHQTYRRDYSTVNRLAEELMTFAADHGFADHRAKGLIFHGWAVSMLGEPARGLELLESGLDRQKEIGTSEDFPIYYCLHAEAMAAAGRPEGAVEGLERARRESEAMGLKIWLPEVWRTLGDMLVASRSGRESAAQRAYQEAAILADQQGAVMLGLRIAVSQARLALAFDAPAPALMHLRRSQSLIAEVDASADLRMAAELLASSSAAGRQSAAAERGK